MATDARPARLPLVAIVGRPNVGKSSLVNRVIGRREAIVDETPGVTRDRRSFAADWGGRTFEIVDTGGLEPGQQGLEARVAEQAEVAIAAADVIVLVVDTAVGPNEDDLAVAAALRRSGKPVVVAANKADDPRDEPSASAFYRLGLGDPVPVSALHGRGSGDLLDEIVARLPETTAAPSGEWAAVAIVGRPNVGKSSLLNALMGEERAIVHDVPGTTRDPVDSLLALDDGRVLRIVDTAGMRRKVQVSEQPLEYFSWLRSRRTLERVDGAILVVDAADGVTGPDQRIAEAIVDAGRSCVVVLNKWDLVDLDEVERRRYDEDVERKLRFLPWAHRVRTSATTGRGMKRVLPALDEAIASHRARIPTATLNRLVGDAQHARPHPRVRGRATRVLYAVQAGVGPPTVVLFTTGPVEESYRRYLENRIRAAEPFTGSPLVLQVRPRERR